MALPSVSVAPSTLESPGRLFDGPSDTSRVRGHEQPPDSEEQQEQPDPSDEPDEPEQAGAQALDVVFEGLAGPDAAAESDGPWAALAVIAGVAVAERHRKDEG
jgi:hypothetical protein